MKGNMTCSQRLKTSNISLRTFYIGAMSMIYAHYDVIKLTVVLYFYVLHDEQKKGKNEIE